MTVGAVVVPASVDEALWDAAGRVAVRRIVDAAWAGGALPIIVVADDPDDRLAAALEGSPARLVPVQSGTDVGPAAPGQPAPPDRTASEAGLAAVAGLAPDGYAAGVDAALAAVQETTALLLWPGRMTWVDPETVTSLIEAHGRAPDAVLRPQRAGQDGWPVLVPASEAGRLLTPESRAARPEGGAEGLEARLADLVIGRVELGDPGSVLGREVDLDSLPDYAGPPEPVGGPPPEWGAAAAETPDPETVPGSP